MEIRFTRHARNKIRLYKLTLEEVEDVIHSGAKENQADRFESRLGVLKVIWLMVGSYALVVTVIRTRGK